MTRTRPWELRRRRRFGTEHVGWFQSLRLAQLNARKDIEANLNEGRIEGIDRPSQTVYYNIYEEVY